MLDFINNNGVLFSGLFSIVTALIAAIVSLVNSNRKNKLDTIQSLKKELAETKTELTETKSKLSSLENEVSRYKALERDEENIDKSRGSIYSEKLPSGQLRSICGFCWERSHAKMPLTPEEYWDEDARRYSRSAYCWSCKSNCYDSK